MKISFAWIFILLVLVIAMASAQQQCSQYEVWKQCSSSCEPACDQPDPQTCDKKCNAPKCQCRKGMVRNKENKCILRSQC